MINYNTLLLVQFNDKFVIKTIKNVMNRVGKAARAGKGKGTPRDVTTAPQHFHELEYHFPECFEWFESRTFQ